MNSRRINVIALALLSVFLFGGTANANPGYLTTENNLNGRARKVDIVRDDNYYRFADDAHDIHDGERGSQPSLYPDIYTNIPSWELWQDVRPEDSNIPYDIRLNLSGPITSTQSNWLVFEMLYDGYKFGSEPIIFQSDRLPYGDVVDVRRAINQNSGDLPLIDAPIGTSGEYGSGILEIGTRFLGDTNDSGHVDLGDFAILANDFGKPQGQHVGDISGPNGIPDGYVDNYDLAAFSEDWLKDINDPGTW